MKTLIFNGAPHPCGDTAALLSVLRASLGGDILEITPKNSFSPCIDCRYCKTHSGCALHDDMDAVYRFLPDCDCVVLASPVWYSSLSGPLLNMASRLQPYFCARFFRKEDTGLHPGHGLILLAGGQRGTENAPVRTASVILQNIGVPKEHITVIASMNTDHLPAKDDTAAQEAIRRAVCQIRAGDRR